MPYIKDENNRREQLRDGDIAKNAGELNYQIFSYLKSHLEKPFYSFAPYDPWIIIDYVRAFVSKYPNYQKYNDMVGCLKCCYKEFYRRYGKEVKLLLEIIDYYDQEIGKYEDKKIVENGDV